MDELRDLGAEPDEPGMRGVSFRADTATLYRVAYATRLASRVLAPLLTFDCHSDKYLYRTARNLDWDRLLDPDRTFVIDASGSDSQIDHSQYAAQRLKDAVCDHFGRRAGGGPAWKSETPTFGSTCTCGTIGPSSESTSVGVHCTVEATERSRWKHLSRRPWPRPSYG